MSITESNLKEAFAGERQANRKHVAFAKKTEQEGFVVHPSKLDSQGLGFLGHFPN